MWLIDQLYIKLGRYIQGIQLQPTVFCDLLQKKVSYVTKLIKTSFSCQIWHCNVLNLLGMSLKVSKYQKNFSCLQFLNKTNDKISQFCPKQQPLKIVEKKIMHFIALIRGYLTYFLYFTTFQRLGQKSRFFLFIFWRN